MRRLLLISVLSAALAGVGTPGIQPAQLMGVGNLTNGDHGPTLDSQI